MIATKARINICPRPIVPQSFFSNSTVWLLRGFVFVKLSNVEHQWDFLVVGIGSGCL